MIKIKNLNQSNNNDINMKDIVELYNNASKIEKRKNIRIITSCYYLQIVLWYYTLTNDITTSFNIQKRFTIIQSEFMYSHTVTTTKELMCWLMNNQNDCKQMNDFIDKSQIYNSTH